MSQKIEDSVAQYQQSCRQIPTTLSSKADSCVIKHRRLWIATGPKGQGDNLRCLHATKQGNYLNSEGQWCPAKGAITDMASAQQG